MRVVLGLATFFGLVHQLRPPRDISEGKGKAEKQVSRLAAGSGRSGPGSPQPETPSAAPGWGQTKA